MDRVRYFFFSYIASYILGVYELVMKNNSTYLQKIYNAKVPQPQKNCNIFVVLCQVWSTLHLTKSWTRLYGKVSNFEVEHFRLTSHFPLRFKTQSVFRVNLSHEMVASDVESPLILYLWLPLPLPSATSTEWAKKVQQFQYGSQLYDVHLLLKPGPLGDKRRMFCLFWPTL